MKGFIIFFSFFISAMGLTLNNCVSADEHVDPLNILILKSKESIYYNQSIHAIGNEFTPTIKNINDKPPLNGANLVISLGAKAAKYSRAHFPNVDKVFAFITLQQSKTLAIHAKETHLLIEQSPQHYLDFVKTLLPNKKVSILFQKKSFKLSNKWKNKARFIEVNSQNNVISATREAIKSSDVLLALPNKNIYNRYSLRGILLTTYQGQTPLISYSPTHVKAGAMAGVYASPSNIGQHISEIVKQLKSNVTIKNKRQFARYFTVKINHRVAQSLGFNLASTKKLIESVNAQRSPQ